MNKNINNNINIRCMAQGEEKALLRLARQALRHAPFERLFISSPKFALVAETDGIITGAVFIRALYDSDKNGKKIGYMDSGFVVKEYRGLGIGRLLYAAAATRLIETGCDFVVGVVRDDNTASWQSLQKQKFGTPSLTELVRILGFFPAVMLWLKTAFCIAWSARLWLNCSVKKRSAAEEMASFVLVNLLLFLPGLIRLTSQPDVLICTLYALPCVLIARIFFGGVGCIVAGDAWYFSFPRGGVLLTLLLNTVGTFFPMLGRWYLKAPLPTREKQRVMGVQAVIEWVGMLILVFLGVFILKDALFFRRCTELAAVLLVYNMIPIPPFGSFGGNRVWDSSKLAFVILSGVFAVMMIVAIIV